MNEEQTTKKINVTLEELVLFRDAVNRYINKYPKERSVLTFGLLKLSAKYEKVQKREAAKATEKIDELTVRLASIKDGNLIENRFDYSTGEKDATNIRYSYTPEKKIELDRAVSKINEELKIQPIEIEPFYVDIPKNFDWSFYPFFKNFVFKPMSEEEEINAYITSPAEEKKPTIESVLKP